MLCLFQASKLYSPFSGIPGLQIPPPPPTAAGALDPKGDKTKYINLGNFFGSQVEQNIYTPFIIVYSFYDQSHLLLGCRGY